MDYLYECIIYDGQTKKAKMWKLNHMALNRKGLNNLCYKPMVTFKDLIKEKRDHELDSLIKVS